MEDILGDKPIIHQSIKYLHPKTMEGDTTTGKREATKGRKHQKREI